MTCILESFCNHDIDGNKNVKKAIGLTIIIKKHIYRRRIKKIIQFFSKPNGYVKFPDAIFYWVRSENGTEIFLSHSELGC